MSRPPANATPATPFPAVPKPGPDGRRRLADWLAEDEAAPLRVAFEGEPAKRALIEGVAEGSPFLWRLCLRDPAGLAALLTAPPEASLNALLSDVAGAGEASGEAEMMRLLRRARTRTALAIALADLGGTFDTLAVTEALSDFADAAVRAALRFYLREAIADGRLLASDPANPEEGLGLFVLALGKHGARELNYSSDIDLAAFFDPDAPGLAASSDPGGLAIALVRKLARALNERTADGYVQRVDLRLRPDPGMTPIAMPTFAALDYYESVGQNWERAAYIKARVVAGDAKAGDAFLGELTPFIWRKYFDYGAIADIHAMKRQIYAVKGHETVAVPGHDLKLGRGGIREIEFFVQTQQLVFGGRRPHLRGRRTLDTLDALAEDGWIEPKARDELREAYLCLRDLEHRVQMLHDEQTQKLPKSDPELAAFARFCGKSRNAFDAALVRQLKRVEAHYSRLFESGPDLASAKGSLVFTGVEDDPETLQTLRRMGFTRPEAVAETVRGWHFGRRPALASARAREVLTELVPELLDAFGRSSDPDGALDGFDGALQRMPAVTELLAILRNNADLRRLFAECLGTAPRLSAIVAQAPHVLDVLIDPDFARSPGTGEVATRIASRLERETEFENFLDRARELARAERFLLGTRVLTRVVPLAEAGVAHTDIAEAFLGEVLARTRVEFATRFGRIEGAEMVVLGMGKAGSREMTASSDLDLVILYDAPEDSSSSGDRPLMASEYFARLTQRLISAISAPMRAGSLYEIDLRLRPSGRKGTVATRLASFEAYQREEAETWEHMALTRARVLAGDSGLATRTAETLRALVAAPRDSGRLRKDAAEMRALMAREKPGRDPFDIKDWPGGLVDCEFAAQVLVLANAARHPSLVGLGTGAAIEEARRLGWVEDAAAEALLAAWRLQSDFAQATRICLAEPFREETTTPVFRKRLAGLLEFPDFRRFAAELGERQKAARAAFRSVVG